MLWQRSDTLPEGLITEDGGRLRVIYPGRANRLAGPDFRDAVMVTEAGDLITGDVELHLNAPDWYGHRHDKDPNYNGVVLHVVLRPRGAARSRQQSGMEAPVASLAHAASVLQSTNPAHSKAASPPAWERPDLEDALDRAGDERFASRSRGFGLMLGDGDPDQIVYTALMEALGYSSNRKPFRELAEKVPMAYLSALRDEPTSTRLLALKAALIGAAGLLSYVSPLEEASQLSRLRARLPRTGAMSGGEWRLFRVRPANHPIARIKGAAHLLESYLETGLVRGLELLVELDDVSSLTRRLTVRPLIGAARARDMAVNVVLPFVHAYAGVCRDSELARRCVELYWACPKLQDNEVTREMERLLEIGSVAPKVATARRQQGLIHMYKSLVRGGTTTRSRAATA